jgi:hypothetical protein
VGEKESGIGKGEGRRRLARTLQIRGGRLLKDRKASRKGEDGRGRGWGSLAE